LVFPYIDLGKAVILVHWQIQRARYRHGCHDPHACGERLHVYPCPADCPKAKRAPAASTPAGNRARAAARAWRQVPQFCTPDCTRHAKSYPQRKGGWKFTRPKGKRKRAVPIPVQFVPSLREHFETQDAEGKMAGGLAEF
jgi:hypothetical protein